MTAAVPTSSEDVCYVSFDRKEEWEQCCAKALGYEDPRLEPAATAPVIHILNLMDDGDTSMIEDNDNVTDHWMDNVNQISASITQMSDMIAKNRKPYLSGDLTEEEASILESTVLSFSATAANQIDSLREAIPPSSPDHFHHCSGIVASLMLRLREEVANPMASLQKQRTRAAMTILQQPLACRLVLRQEREEAGSSSVWDQLVEDEGEGTREQRFLPRQQPPPDASTDFMSAYAPNDDEELRSDLQRPTSLFKKKQTKVDSFEPPSKQVKFTMDTKKANEERFLYQQQQDAQESTQQELQREAALLEIKLHGDLESVYQVEQRMTEITALLSQFAGLVSEQQEEIDSIHHSAVSSKDNLSKGQESLIDAKERTKQSKHYMATFVSSIAILLLLFNYIAP